MNLKIISESLKGNYKIKKFDVVTTYVFKLQDKKGAITAQFKNDEFIRMTIDGNEKEKIIKLFDNSVDKDKIV